MHTVPVSVSLVNKMRQDREKQVKRTKEAQPAWTQTHGKIKNEWTTCQRGKCNQKDGRDKREKGTRETAARNRGQVRKQKKRKRKRSKHTEDGTITEEKDVSEGEGNTETGKKRKNKQKEHKKRNGQASKTKTLITKKTCKSIVEKGRRRK